MELANPDIFKKYKEINIDDINKFEDINIIDKVIQKHIEDLDDSYFKFLTKNGYKIDKPYNIEQLKQIKEDLASKDKILDNIEWVEYKQDNDNDIILRHIIPFFNSINNRGFIINIY